MAEEIALSVKACMSKNLFIFMVSFRPKSPNGDCKYNFDVKT